jgi:hypothetical protein
VTLVAEGGVGRTPTTVAEPVLATEAATPTSVAQRVTTLTAPTGEAPTGEASSIRLVLAVLVAAAVGGSVIFIRANRRRRDAERRRMDVMDSMRS